MPLFSEHISNMYYSGSPSYTGVPYSYSSSGSPLGSSYSASYLNPGGNYSNHSSLGNYSRAPLTSRWISGVGRSYSPMLGTISERSTASPVRINSPRRLPITTRTYGSSGYILRPVNINTADIDVSRDKYRQKVYHHVPSTTEQREQLSTEKENGPFMPRVDGKPETGIDSSPGVQRSTIKRGRTVVRFHTLRRKERDSPRKHAEVSQNDTMTSSVNVTDEKPISKNEEPNESTSWRERLSEELTYKDKKEKKTLGAKLVEKFKLKEAVDKDVETVPTQSLNKLEVIPILPESSLPKINSVTNKSPDRRCSMELLAEQAQLLDSLIRRENLSTTTLDLSKVGNVHDMTNNVKGHGSVKRSKSIDHENPLKTTKSDYSLHTSLNSFKDKKVSKKPSLKKSLSGGSICRLDSITEFPREPININLPAIEESRHITKQESTKLKPKPKLKAKITTSVEVTTPKSPLKFRIENVVVEEKPRVPKKEIIFSSEVDETPAQIIELPKSTTPQETIQEHLIDNKKSKNGFISECDIPSPEPDDGNFWNKIGKRETVYLMKRKQNLDDTKEKHNRALYWFPEEDDSNINKECNEASDNSIISRESNDLNATKDIDNQVIETKNLHQDITAESNKMNESLNEVDLSQVNYDNRENHKSRAVDLSMQAEPAESSHILEKQNDNETKQILESCNIAEVTGLTASNEQLTKREESITSGENNLVIGNYDLKTQASKTNDVDQGQEINTNKVNTDVQILGCDTVSQTESQLTKKIDTVKDVSAMASEYNNSALENYKVETQTSEIAGSDQIKAHKCPDVSENNSKADNKIVETKTVPKLLQFSVQENIDQAKVSENPATLEEENITPSNTQNIVSSQKNKIKPKLTNVKNQNNIEKKILDKNNTPAHNHKDNNDKKKKTPIKNIDGNNSKAQKLKESEDSVENKGIHILKENESKGKIEHIKMESSLRSALSTNNIDNTAEQFNETLSSDDQSVTSKCVDTSNEQLKEVISNATLISNDDQPDTRKCTDTPTEQLKELPGFIAENFTESNSNKIFNDPEISVVVESRNIPVKPNEPKDNCQIQDEGNTGEDNKSENVTTKDEPEPNRQSNKEIVQQPPPPNPRKPAKIVAPLRPLIATPRPLQKKPPQVIHSSDSSDSSSEEDSSDDDDASETSEDSAEFFECETNPDGRTSTGSNDSGFDSSAPTSPSSFLQIKKDCDVNCHRKCEKLTANLCGVNQRLLVEALATRPASKKGGDIPGTSSGSATVANNSTDILEQELEQSTAYGLFRKTGRFTPPARSIPRFRKYTIEDFQFIKVLGKGSFGKVLLAELRDTEYYYAVKCLKKDVVLEDDDVECTLIERKVLALGTNHPYLCHLFATFQTDSHLFFVMEYLNGGDLMFHIQQSGRFPEVRARFYAAEIVSGLKFLHKRGIVYRDLKLDNILLDFDGHVRIADFGMCKLQIYLDKTADTFCGTPDYMAPEIIKGLKYNQTVDWWSFGVLLYEMLIGQSPFSGCDEDELFWSICNEMPSYPRFLSQQALTILTRLLDKDARSRLGGTECMHGDIRDQEFFQPIHWDRLERRDLEAPFRPRVRHPLDTQYFDRAFTGERPRLTAVEPQVLRSMDQEPFRGFSYTNPNATDR